MTKYIAFLRAINVGGNAVIKMDDLRRMFESFGLVNVQTYIQSGNVIFETDDEDTLTLETRIEGQLEKALGYKVPLFVRTMRELASIAEKPPFQPKEKETVHVVFMGRSPDKKSVQTLMSYKSEADDFLVKGREAYNLRHNKDKSMFSNNWVEKILGVTGTTRNLNTVQKIVNKYGK